MIKMSNVYKSYEKDGNLALNNISLHIEKGDFVFLTGQSGAGKSTLIKLLFREILPDSGQIFVANRSIIRLSAKETVMLRRNTGVVFQDFRLMENKTVFENVAFALKVLEYPWAQIKETVPLVLKRLNILEKADAFPPANSSVWLWRGQSSTTHPFCWRTNPRVTLTPILPTN